MEQLTGEDSAHIGPYRLIARLGAGGMGLVYLGRSDLGRTVAVKVVQAEHAQHAEFRRRFAREVAAARRVGGARTADVLDADTDAAVPWVATQYIPGPDLTTVVAQDFGPLPEHSVRTLANRLALRAVHEAGLIHRDLKPSNVLVTVDGPRLIDFGIARARDSLAGDSLHTRTGMLIGSPGFMSPAQARGLELTPASDVFCLGALLVYAATGRLLFGATDTGPNAHLFRIAEEEADLTGVPDALVDLPLVADRNDRRPRRTARRPDPGTRRLLPGGGPDRRRRRPPAHGRRILPPLTPPATRAQEGWAGDRLRRLSCGGPSVRRMDTKTTEKTEEAAVRPDGESTGDTAVADGADLPAELREDDREDDRDAEGDDELARDEAAAVAVGPEGTGVGAAAAAVVSAALSVVALTGTWTGRVVAERETLVGQIKTSGTGTPAQQISEIYGDAWHSTALVNGAFALLAVIVAVLVLALPRRPLRVRAIAVAGAVLGGLGLLLSAGTYFDLFLSLPTAGS
ncbi:serine/threonine-protein kinase [Streptomyces roseolus]|uniref:serine/threonine-protein kinase n=1 Tax=Streptomyces roseolus TaxID=67358 RepID=UPI0033EE73FA